MGRTLDALKLAEERRASTRGPTDAQPRRFQLISVASNKGGVGKSTLAVHLAVYARALRERWPITVLSLDDQPAVEETFGVAGQGPELPIVEALRTHQLRRGVTLGQYGIAYARMPASLERLASVLSEPGALDAILRAARAEGLIIVDTKSDLGPATRAALQASDLVVSPVRDLPSLEEAGKVRAALVRLGVADRFHVALAGVDLRIKFKGEQEEDILALLLGELRRRKWPHFATVLSRSPTVEALATAPGQSRRTVLHAAPRSIFHRQMCALTPEVLERLDLAPREALPPRTERARVGPPDSTLPEATPAGRFRDLFRVRRSP